MDKSFVISQYKGAIILTFLLLFFILGRLFPFTKVSQAFSRIANNLVLSGCNVFLSTLIVIPIAAFASNHSLNWRPDWLHGWIAVIFDLALLDCWIYWLHRAQHAVPIFWRFHEVHHLDETLDASTALRFHFGEVFISSLMRLPVIMLLAIPLPNIIWFETMVAMAAIFHHSNLRFPQGFERALSSIIVTPAIHWVHHHAIRADTDSNYAVFFSVWDRLFDSQSLTIRTADLVIGVEGKRDQNLLTLLAWPVLRSKAGLVQG
jgi:sterol desaturase/sphingolipid hydroxylase (fatty acid hydroxylase superfamily)